MLENRLFFIITLFSKKLKDLNTPDLNIRCPCSGKLIKYAVTNRGGHYFCLRCFTRWVKPTRGDLYKTRTRLSYFWKRRYA